jgi:hypothetical protein
MGRLGAKEILDVISKNYSEENFAYGEWCELEGASEKIPGWDQLGWKEKYSAALNFLNLGEIESIERVGGEGEGDHWHQVWYFKYHDVYIKIVGHYQSYHGAEFYDGYGTEVKPVQKTITVFE